MDTVPQPSRAQTKMETWVCPEKAAQETGDQESRREMGDFGRPGQRNAGGGRDDPT